MIVSGGANVFPAEVEAAISEHPKVRDIVVIGLPDPESGDTGSTPSSSRPTPPTSPTRTCPPSSTRTPRSRLAAYKVPKAYELVERMPRSEAGKVNRSNLAADAPDPFRRSAAFLAR